ncbi:MAG: hypothetical protein OEW18_11570, partial [Candidatus Aminicenantes bacterium]|nr:hypothetical protein [Candidatus Aminicenantes bacterium]
GEPAAAIGAELQQPQLFLEPALPLFLRLHTFRQHLSSAALLFRNLLTVHFLGSQIVFVIQKRRLFLWFYLPIITANFLRFALRSVPLFLLFFFLSLFFFLPGQFQRLRP